MNASPLTVALYTRMAVAEITSLLSARPDVRLIEAKSIDDLLAATRAADVLAISDPVKDEGRLLASALVAADCRVKWIQVLSAGFDGLAKHGVPKAIMVSTQGGALSVPVAEHAMALLLALTRQISVVSSRSAAGEWNRTFAPPLITLEGRHALIVAMGHVGRQVAKRLRAFDVHITGASRSGDLLEHADEGVRLDDLAVAIPRADIIMVCAALTDATRGLIGRRTLSVLKPGALLVNVARGELLDQDALLDALKEHRLAGAALDVTVPEPLPKDNALWSAGNVIITPHVAGAGSPRAMGRIAKTLGDNLDRYLRGEPVHHGVNP
jgi:phosphoglycerate dehydrogenase-like enzyme